MIASCWGLFFFIIIVHNISMNTAKYQDMVKVDLQSGAEQHRQSEVINFDAGIIAAQSEIIGSLCRARDLIKKAFDSCIDTINAPTIYKINTAIKVSCTKTGKFLSEDNRKYKMNNKKAARKIQLMNKEEADIFAVSLASEKLFITLCDVVMNKCLRGFSQLKTTHMLKQRTKAIVHNIADDVCAQFAAKTHELLSV